MLKDIDEILKEKYKRIQVPQGMFKVNLLDFKKRILFFKFTVIVITMFAIITALVLTLQIKLQCDMDIFWNLYN